MIFLHPTSLIIMLIPLLILSFFILTNQSYIHQIFSKQILEKLTFNKNSNSKTRQNILILSSLILMILAFARPIVLKEEIILKQNIPSLTIVLDISSSMLSSDIYPNRLIFAKKKILELIDKFENVNLSIYAFSEKLYLLSPKTTDINSVKFLINHLHIKSTQHNSTNFLELFTHIKEEENIVIFTDTSSHTDFSKEIKLIKEHRQKVHIYAVTSTQGSAIKIDNNFLTDTNNKIIISKLNTNIKQLSLSSGGIFKIYTHDNNSTTDIANAIKNTQAVLTNSGYRDKIELFTYPLALAIFLIFITFYSIKKDAKLEI